ncbi:MAG: hypothetical protein N7Q72_06865, partial [Spiroplasma sp. Tabriz.8]|nr:hypothetical protein [Spiroplasma sp. Tabriz.8]
CFATFVSSFWPSILITSNLLFSSVSLLTCLFIFFHIYIYIYIYIYNMFFFHYLSFLFIMFVHHYKRIIFG